VGWVCMFVQRTVFVSALSEGRGDRCLEHGALTHLTAVRIEVETELHFTSLSFAKMTANTTATNSAP
jgi:hypothetical protein